MYMSTEDFNKFAVGQEVICPDGLGIITYIRRAGIQYRCIQVSTYENDRNIKWAPEKITFVK